jgi:ribonuclease-3
LDLETQRRVAEGIMGHQFARPSLLTEALTHRSAAHSKRGAGNRTRGQHERRGAGSNERLEFVGDRVLGLVIAEWLIERFPEEQEGELGRRFAQLVSRPILAGIAESLGLQAALAIAPNEARAGVGALANTLADAMEAAIGALFLDAGLDQARRFVRGAWASAMEGQLQPPKDAKTALQEWLMARAMPLPAYVEMDRTGPSHAPSFVIEVTGAGQSGTGSGTNKREAERAAAADLLGKLRK